MQNFMLLSLTGTILSLAAALVDNGQHKPILIHILVNFIRWLDRCQCRRLNSLPG